MKTIPNTPHNISKREKQVLELIAFEHNTQQIAEKLLVSYETAQSHRKNLLKKLKVKNTAGMVRVAFERGILSISKVAVGRMACCLMMCLSIMAIGQAQVIWDGSESQDWHDLNNWTPNTVPTITDAVSILTTTNPPIISANAYAREIFISDDSLVVSADTLFINSSNAPAATDGIDVDGSTSLIVAEGAVLDIAHAVNDAIEIRGKVENHGSIFIQTDKDGIWLQSGSLMNHGRMKIEGPVGRVGIQVNGGAELINMSCGHLTLDNELKIEGGAVTNNGYIAYYSSDFTNSGTYTDIGIQYDPMSSLDDDMTLVVACDTPYEDYSINCALDIDLSSHLVSYWKFDGDVTDDRGTNHGTIVGSGVTYPLGKFGVGIDLDGSDPYVSVDHDASLDFTNKSLTISAWFRVDAFDKLFQTLISKGEGQNFRIARWLASDSLSYNGGNNGDITATVDVKDGLFHHVVAVTEAGVSTKLYIDGVLSVENLSNVNITDSGLSLLIGNNPDQLGRSWNGMIDDLAMWDKPLSAADVSFIYNADMSIGNIIAQVGVCATATPTCFISDYGACSMQTTIPFSTNGMTDSGQDAGSCGDAGVDQFFTWTATTTHLTWTADLNSMPMGIHVLRDDCITSIDCANVVTSPQTLSGWSIGDDLIIQIFNLEASGIADASFCLEDACGSAGTPSNADVCNDSTVPINLYDLLTDEDPGGHWFEGAGTFNPNGQPMGVYTFTYLAPGVCGNTSSVTVSVAENNSAGDDDVELFLPLGDVQNIDLFSQLQNADPGGTWTSITQPEPPEFSVDQNNDAFFNADGSAPLGIYRFRYSQTNASPCFNQSKEVTIRITPTNDFICDAEILTVGTIGSDPECGGANPYTLSYSSVETNEEEASCSECEITTAYNTDYAKKNVAIFGQQSVWFKFIAPSLGQVNLSIDHPQTNFQFSEVSISLWEEEQVFVLQEQSKKSASSPQTSLCGISVSDLTEINCARGNGWESCGTAIMNQDLVPGAEYYVKVESCNDDVDFCLTITEVAIPTNVDPNPAVTLAISPDGTCSTVTPATTRGTANMLTDDATIPYFELENTSGIEKFYQVSYIHTGLPKELPTLVGDGDFKNFFFPYHTTINLDAGASSIEVFIPLDNSTFDINFQSNPYYIRIIETDFDICVVECSPAPNYSPGAAAPIMLSDDSCDNIVTGTTACAPDGALYYSFIAPTTANYTFTSAGSVIRVNNLSNRDELVVSLIQGTSYSIRVLPNEVQQFLGESIDVAKPSIFSLCVRSCADSVPPNDLCADAIPLVMSVPDPIEQTCRNGNTFNIAGIISVCEDFTYGCATDSGEGDPTYDGGISASSGYNPGLDQWYSVTVPEGGALTISIKDESVPFNNNRFAYELYEGGCGSLISLGHIGDGIWWSGLSPGITLYIRIWQVENNVGSHATLCISSGGFFANNCPEILNLSGMNSGISDMSTRMNDGIINSDQRLESSSDVIYDSGSEINLDAGFEVEAGAVFHAYIEGCESAGF